ncbi:MAG: ComEC/Rec2 family competence protein [Planctomycetaceae bacterium]|nr:ComEC/Rec2 family competence protein [Planctomycetaceae bacterium]
MLVFAGASLCAVAVFLNRTGWLALAGALLFAWGYGAFRATPAEDDLSLLFPGGIALAMIEGTVAEGTGYLIAHEDVRGDVDVPAIFRGRDSPSSRFVLDIERELTTGETVSGRVKVYVNGEAAYRAGERIRLTCALDRPRPVRNPGELDIAQLYADRGIRMLAFVESPALIERLGESGSYRLQRIAEDTREWVGQRIQLETRNGMLLRCVLLGDRAALSPEVNDDYLRSGSMHILVVSGLHVMVLGFAVLWLCRWFGWDAKWRMLLVALVALVFLVVTGIQLAAVRAVVLVLLVAAAEWLGRKPDMLNLLAVATLVVLAWQPADLFSYSFILSYGSVLALILFMPLFQFRQGPETEDTRRFTLFHKVGDSMLGSAVVTLATFPVVLGGWNLLSPVSALVNLVVLPVLGLTLGSGLLLPLAVFPPIAPVLSGWYDLLLGLFDRIVTWAAAVEGGHFYLPDPPLWWVIVFYSALAGVALIRGARRWRLLPVGALIAALALLPWAGNERTRTHAGLTVLDAGHGASTVIETQNNRVIVVDAGSQQRPHVSSFTIAPFLFQRGHDRIDILALTHPDSDHVNGVAGLVERFEVGEVWISPAFEDGKSGSELAAWLRAQPSVGKIRVMQAGATQRLDGVTLRTLWPDPEFARRAKSDSSGANEAGLVIFADLGYGSVLITGDAEDVAVTGIGAGMPRCDVLIAPHHGSDFAGLDALLANTKPKFIVLSAREGFTPHSVEQRLRETAPLYQTWRHGALSIRAMGSALAVVPFIE